MLAFLTPWLLVLPGPPTCVQESGEGAAAQPLPPVVEDAWRGLVERDQRVSFTARSLSLASSFLEHADLSARERAAALMALGAVRAPNETARLEAWAREGDPLVRCAAAFALGEYGASESGFLLELATRARGEVAQAVLFALLRGGSGEGLVHVSTVAQGADDLARAARDLIVFHADRAGSTSTTAARRWLELRWEAAKRFGLIDGRTWSARVLGELAGDALFLDRVVLTAAASIKHPAVRDHFLEILLGGGGSQRLRAVVAAIPTELDQLVFSNLWTPADEIEWTDLLSAIDEQRLEALCPGTLRQARVVPSLQTYASILLVRGGNQEGMPLLELELSSDNAEARARIAEAFGALKQPTLKPRLMLLAGDLDVGVRSHATVALLRLGVPQVRDRLVSVFSNQESSERTILLDALCRASRDALVRAVLADLLPTLLKSEQVRVAAVLSEVGRIGERYLVREALARVAPTGRLGVELVRGLSIAPMPDELAVLRSHFPMEGELDVNVELALALIGASDPVALPVLRAALWSEPWNRGVLAGFLLAQHYGIDALKDELRRAPAGATGRDLRRVGFALGELGGLAMVDELSKSGGAGEPAVQGALLGALATRTH